MTAAEALQIVRQVCRKYQGTADDHELIARALSVIEGALTAPEG
jgi:hypothetical protein